MINLNSVLRGNSRLNIFVILIFLGLGAFVSVLAFKKFYKSSVQVLGAKDFPKNTYPCVVVGGGAGGLTSAIYLTQLGCKTLVLRGQGAPGGALAKTNSVQNWPGEINITGASLIEKLNEHALSFGALMLNRDAVSFNFKSWPFEITFTGENKTSQKIYALSCIVATGASANRLDVPGESEYWGRGVTNCAICDAPMFKNQEVAVVGGGDAAVTEIELLSPVVSKIYLLVRGKQLRAKGSRVEKLLKNPKVEVMYSSSIKEILGDALGVHSVKLDVGDGQEKSLPVSGVFLAIGSRPNTKMFENQLQLNANGSVVLHNGQQSSVKGVYAIGDVSDEKYRQAITAAGSGCAAALQALEFLAEKNVNLTDFSFVVPESTSVDQSSESKAKPKKNLTAESEIVFELDGEVDGRECREKAVPESEEDSQELAFTVENLAQLKQLIEQKSLPLVLDCYATWCMPCKMMQPMFEEFAQQYKDKVIFAKANADVAESLFKNLGVRGVPTFVFFDKSGNEATRVVGQIDEDDFIEHLKKIL